MQELPKNITFLTPEYDHASSDDIGKNVIGGDVVCLIHFPHLNTENFGF
jgi:hypothetical protein